ncbi:glutamate racemase [Noviherbaspirillum pedocola]|uniref:Glutamate racemase n=1 Tax=Noviherbaspirillum pedocola TaxID=2801341 RepID=A0A934T070_9BURK|nr:glutamate racemase [Noviherbaspirillum pedocola]MBK4736322.1 glutamate racemase [Noviherbaspirillum pedocola]
MTQTLPTMASAPVGIFDSGLGGLSVLKHVRQQLPHEPLIYVADSAHAPYGGKSEDEVLARTLAIGDFLVAQGVKAIVVACNTATAAAIAALRQRYPELPVVGVEPGLKPAARASRSRIVGVLATERTLASARFRALEAGIAADTGVRFLAQPCPGLADQVEKGELRSAATAALVQRYVAPLIVSGADVLVLGCTHYPFLSETIRNAAGAAGAGELAIIDTGDAVARQLCRRLDEHVSTQSLVIQPVLGFTTGSVSSLQSAFKKLLDMEIEIGQLKKVAD